MIYNILCNHTSGITLILMGVNSILVLLNLFLLKKIKGMRQFWYDRRDKYYSLQAAVAVYAELEAIADEKNGLMLQPGNRTARDARDGSFKVGVM